jgi:hypothetical protein
VLSDRDGADAAELVARLLETVGPNMPFKTKRLVELAANPNYRFGDGSLYDLMNVSA